MFQLEDGRYRQTWLLTDRLSDGWENSMVQGLRSDRMALGGLCTGQTQRSSWLSKLGAPDASVELDAERAELQRVVPGTSDYYTYGGVQLRLHADEDGILRSIFLLR